VGVLQVCAGGGVGGLLGGEVRHGGGVPVPIRDGLGEVAAEPGDLLVAGGGAGLGVIAAGAVLSELVGLGGGLLGEGLDLPAGGVGCPACLARGPLEVGGGDRVQPGGLGPHGGQFSLDGLGGLERGQFGHIRASTWVSTEVEVPCRAVIRSVATSRSRTPAYLTRPGSRGSLVPGGAAAHAGGAKPGGSLAAGPPNITAVIPGCGAGAPGRES